jgi:osmotically-inducible protein OsmY
MITVGSTISDERLRHNIERELADEPSIDAREIGVAAKAGIITLSGHVATYAEKIAAEHIAGRVYGVRAVIADLEVKLPVSSQLGNEEIARKAVETLSWNTAIPADRIKIYVEDGWVTLEGDVDWSYQKTAAHNAIAYLKGVRGVRDRLMIKPVSVSTATKAHIEAVLARRLGPRNSRHITVEASGDHVTLRGTVTSLAEREEVERATWTTPGVCQVNNNLAVRRPGGRRRTRQ